MRTTKDKVMDEAMRRLQANNFDIINKTIFGDTVCQCGHEKNPGDQYCLTCQSCIEDAEMDEC